MHLTPDDIASRSFTPSVDGYHQGEVRSFLQRVSGQLRSVPSATSGATTELSAGAEVSDREHRLAELERKLGQLISDLAVATDKSQQAQPGIVAHAIAGNGRAISASAVEQQQVAMDLQAERQALSELQASLREQHESLVTQQQSLSEQQQAFLAKQENFEEQQQAFATNQQALAEQQEAFAASQQALAEQQQSLSEQQEMLGEHLDDTRKLATPLPATPPDQASSPGIIPPSLTGPSQSTRPQSQITAAASEAESVAIFASDLDDQPLFSDSANDLLDGVLNDVMGDITEEGNTA